MAAQRRGKQICDFFHKGQKVHRKLTGPMVAVVIQVALVSGGGLRRIKKRNMRLLRE
jgi:hypothetical protein